MQPIPAVFLRLQHFVYTNFHRDPEREPSWDFLRMGFRGSKQCAETAVKSVILSTSVAGFLGEIGSDYKNCQQMRPLLL